MQSHQLGDMTTIYSRGFTFTESKLGEIASERGLENKIEPRACSFFVMKKPKIHHTSHCIQAIQA